MESFPYHVRECGTLGQQKPDDHSLGVLRGGISTIHLGHGSQLEATVPLKAHLAMSGAIFGCQNWGGYYYI